MWVGLSRQHRAASHLRRHNASTRRAVPGRTVTQTRSANRGSSWRATARARRVLLNAAGAGQAHERMCGRKAEDPVQLPVPANQLGGRAFDVLMARIEARGTVLGKA